VYLHLIDNPGITGVYNAGFENISIMDIAKLVTKYLPVEIAVTTSSDPRSYRINSDKLLATGYKPKKTVEDAIREIIEQYRAGVLEDEDHFYNLRWMEKTVLSKEVKK
jgi:nucleoside-diphosphate-sugar epimerase